MREDRSNPAPPLFGRLSLLVLVDVQREYSTPGRPFCIGSIGESLENGRRLLAHARRQAWPIAHVRHLQSGHLFNEALEYSRFVEGFEPLPNEMLFGKSQLSCYASEGFRAFMHSARGEQVYLAGYTSQMSCLATVLDGFGQGHRFNFVVDASGARATAHAAEREAHQHAADIIAIYAGIVSVDDVVKMTAAA